MVHHVVVVPGLGGPNIWLPKILQSWKTYGLTPHIYDIGWKDTNTSFAFKLHTFLTYIDSLTRKNQHISLLGTSAGGSAVLNAFVERKNTIHKVVNVCGRLRTGTNVFSTLQMAARTSRAFRESVELFEKKESFLKDSDRRKILTIRPLFDEIVPVSTVSLSDAHNIQIVSVEHMISISLAMTLYASKIINFLEEE